MHPNSSDSGAQSCLPLRIIPTHLIGCGALPALKAGGLLCVSLVCPKPSEQHEGQWHTPGQGHMMGVRPGKDLSNPLSPPEALLCRAANLARLDQKQMLAIREAWFEEVGGPPTGNKRGSPLPSPHQSTLLPPMFKQSKVQSFGFSAPRQPASTESTLTWRWHATD